MTLLSDSGCADSNIVDAVAAVKDAFDRAAKRRPLRSELRTKAEHLEKASREIVKALGSAKDLHFFLRRAKTLANDGLASDVGQSHALSEARMFDDKARIIFSNLRDIRSGFLAIAEASKTLLDSKRAHPVFPREGKPVNEERRQLGIDLAGLWHMATGKLPTTSGSASLERPGSPFGRFVVLAAETFERRDAIEVGFAGLLRRACSDYRHPRPSSRLSSDDDGVETPEEK
jgi:hypothetical protein